MTQRSRRPRYLERLAALVTMVTVLVAVIQAGSVYFFCAPMGRVMVTECCHPDEGMNAISGAKPTTVSQPCCEAHAIGAPTAGAFTRGASIPVAPLLAVLSPTSLGSELQLALDDHARVWHSGVDPPRQSPREYRLLLQVFLS